MGHYHTDFHGPNFSIWHDCRLTEEVETVLLKFLRKKDKKVKDVIALHVESVTTDSNRIWYNVKYHTDSIKGTTCFRTISVEKVHKMLGDKTVDKHMKKLEKIRREELKRD